MAKRHRSTYKIYARKNWFIRNRIWLLCGLGVLLLLAIGAYLFTHISKKEETGIQYEKMSAASLPTISMQYGEHQVNLLRGYTQEMDIHYVRRTIFILEDTYDVPIIINKYGNKIKSINYTVIDVENNNLIQDSTIEDLKTSGQEISCDLHIENIIEDGKEYVLTISIVTDADEKINYYTRIKSDADTTLSKQLELALDFNQRIYNVNEGENEAYITGVLETKYWLDDNTDFGNVSLYSSISQVTWGKMKVAPKEEPYIEILDVDGELGYFMLTYTVTRQEEDTEEYYAVSEFYRIRLTDKYEYILNYERSTEQLFEPSVDTISTSSAKIGILSDSDVVKLCNPSGNLSCFVANNTLWAMDTETKTIKRIFTFSSGTNDFRGNYDQHDIDIINVSDSGDIQFIVYGYMNAGLHEGKVGIAMYTYHANTQLVEEDVFLPTNLPYEVLKNSVGSLFYLSNNNSLYIVMDQCLYKLDLDSDEAEIVADGLTEGNFCIHSSSRYIAWHEGARINDAKKITVLDMETGDSYEIEADEGCCVKALGFLNQEFVYGQGKEGKTYVDDDEKTHLLMTDMYVVNSKLQIQDHNNSGSDYFVGAESEYNRVVIKKVTKTEAGYVSSDDFTIFATDLESYATLGMYTDYEEIKKTVYYVEFADSTTSAGNLTINNEAEVLFTNGKIINISNMIKEPTEYIVYAQGEINSLEEEAADAIDTAYRLCGVVLKPDGTVFYKRAVLPGEAEMSDIALEKAISKMQEGDMINVTGISLVEALYYIGNKKALVWERDDGTYIIKGYDYYDNILMYNVDTAEEVKVASDDITDMIANTGHIYVVE